MRRYPDGRKYEPSALDKILFAGAKMPFLICSFYLITSVPFTIFSLIKTVHFSNVTDEKLYAKLQLTRAILQMMLYCNFTFNFWMYFASGSLFKEEWNQIVTSIQRKFTGTFSAFRDRFLVNGDTTSRAVYSMPQPQPVMVSVV